MRFFKMFLSTCSCWKTTYQTAISHSRECLLCSPLFLALQQKIWTYPSLQSPDTCGSSWSHRKHFWRRNVGRRCSKSGLTWLLCFNASYPHRIPSWDQPKNTYSVFKQSEMSSLRWNSFACIKSSMKLNREKNKAFWKSRARPLI